MRSRDELTSLFTSYFGGKLSDTQIDALVADTMAAARDRSVPTLAARKAVAEHSQLSQVWTADLS